MINLQKEGITVMLREFDETENNEEDLIIDDQIVLIDEEDLYMNCHSILCSYVKALQPEVIAMILETYSDIDNYVDYIEGLYQKKEIIVEIFGRLSSRLTGK